MSTLLELFWNSFLVTFQFLAILAGVAAAVAVLALVSFYGFCFLRGVYWAATGKPLPPKPAPRC